VIVRVTARWVLPIAAPSLPGGWIDVDTSRDEIVGVGAREAMHASSARGRVARVVDLPDAVLLPGLVNVHTHLELSHLAGRVPPADAFVSWVRSMLAARFGTPTAISAITDAATAAIDFMERTGTAAVGDIGNSDAVIGPLIASSLHGIHFSEALGFDPADASRVHGDTELQAWLTGARLKDATNGRLRASVAPHAPYSTSAPLIQSLAAGLELDVPKVVESSIHLGESPEEVEFLGRGTGPFQSLLEDMGRPVAAWQPPGLRPVDYLQSLGALHARLLIVHGTQLTTSELEILASVGATLALCARSNRWVGAGIPPVAAAVKAGVPLAIGTDSLASVEDLNLFAEMAYLRGVAPDVSAATLLHAATLGGARALGCPTLGRLAPGASSRVLMRTPPADVTDVEQWLVAEAADTHDLRWLPDVVRDAVG